jgi:hypothetical protein
VNIFHPRALEAHSADSHPGTSQLSKLSLTKEYSKLSLRVGVYIGEGYRVVGLIVWCDRGTGGTIPRATAQLSV